MERRSLRSIPRKSYSEIEEPNLDEYVFCEKCADFVYEYCSIHGPLLVVPDDKAPPKTTFPSFVPRAALTIPRVFMHLAPSIIPGAGLGVFSTLTLPCGIRFGPYRGRLTKDIESTYCWQIRDSNNKRSHVIDASDANTSNWMRYVNCARHWHEQNLVAYQYQGQIYYRTIKIIPRYTEMLVFYGSEFAASLHVDLRTYNSPAGYAQKFGAPAPKKLKLENNTKQTSEKGNMAEKLSTKKEIKTGIHNAKVKHGKENKQPFFKTKKTFCKKNNDKNNNKMPKSKDQSNLKNLDKIILICERCGHIFKCKDTLGFHLKTHESKIDEGNDILKTTNCETNRNADNFKQSNLDTCNNSQEEFLTETKLGVHSTIHTGEKPFTCSYCKKSFTVKSNLKRHVRMHTGEKPFTCSYCKKSFIQKGELKSHVRIHTGEKPFTCSYCKKSFTVKSNLKRHVRMHTGEKPFTCSYCKKSFIQKGELKSHVRIHTGEKPFTCSYCKKSFTDKSYLKRHISIHTGEKPFTCSYCKKSFIRKNDLKRHVRIHTGEKPFTCSYCKKSFTQKVSLNKHVRIHTGEKPFTCSYCEQSFTNKSSLTYHLSKHTGEKSYTCNYCKIPFTLKSNLKDHIKKHTSQNPVI